MTIAKILVPLRGDGKGEGVLEHAVAIAQPFSAHIEALYCQPQSSDMLPFGVVVPQVLRRQIEQSMSAVGTTERERIHGLFDAFAEQHGVEVVTGGNVPPRDRVTLGWREAMGRQADLLGPHGRMADLIAVPRPDHDSNLGFNTLYAALMNTGRPVLMCPDGAPSAAMPGHVAIAWNGSIEASRAVALGTDLLSAAEAVTVLTAGGEPGDSVSGAAALIDYLRVRGVSATHKPLTTKGDIGAGLLSGAAEAGATMLLMGAYSHSRGRESLFGGVSQHVVDHAAIPVVLVH